MRVVFAARVLPRSVALRCCARPSLTFFSRLTRPRFSSLSIQAVMFGRVTASALESCAGDTPGFSFTSVRMVYSTGRRSSGDFTSLSKTE
jgi:hypothetical protein